MPITLHKKRCLRAVFEKNLGYVKKRRRQTLNKILCSKTEKTVVEFPWNDPTLICSIHFSISLHTLDNGLGTL
jgi:hypothetical protein